MTTDASGQQPGPPQIIPSFGPGEALANVRASDPAAADALMKDAAREIWATIKTKWDTLREVMFTTPPPEDRKQLYTAKTRAVLDPQTQQPQNLWMEQKHTFPDFYEHDVKDAFQLGCELPSWAEEDAISYGAKRPA